MIASGTPGPDRYDTIAETYGPSGIPPGASATPTSIARQPVPSYRAIPVQIVPWSFTPRNPPAYRSTGPPGDVAPARSRCTNVYAAGRSSIGTHPTLVRRSARRYVGGGDCGGAPGG